LLVTGWKKDKVKCADDYLEAACFVHFLGIQLPLLAQVNLRQRASPLCSASAPPQLTSTDLSRG